MRSFVLPGNGLIKLSDLMPGLPPSQCYIKSVSKLHDRSVPTLLSIIKFAVFSVVIMPITPPAGSGSAISTALATSYTTTSVATGLSVNPSEALQKLVDDENPVP